MSRDPGRIPGWAVPLILTAMGFLVLLAAHLGASR